MITFQTRKPVVVQIEYADAAETALIREAAAEDGLSVQDFIQEATASFCRAHGREVVVKPAPRYVTVSPIAVPGFPFFCTPGSLVI